MNAAPDWSAVTVRSTVASMEDVAAVRRDLADAVDAAAKVTDALADGLGRFGEAAEKDLLAHRRSIRRLWWVVSAQSVALVILGVALVVRW